MSRWYLSLPKYVKEAKKKFVNSGYVKIDENKQSFLSALKQTNVGAQELLFSKIPNCFGFETVNDSLLENIASAKNYYDSFIRELKDELIKETIMLLKSKELQTGLAGYSIAWTDSISEAAKDKIYFNGAETILPILSDPENDEYALIGRLAKAVVGLRIEDWNDEFVDKYLGQLKLFIETIEEENNKSVHEEDLENATISDCYSITFIDEYGKTKKKTFERANCSKRAKLLYNLISNNLDEMGQAITPEEKRQVLMEILESLC